jgi:hypothetical protein
MSTYLTNIWTNEMKANLPKCPACGGSIEYGFLISKDAIHWAGELEGNKFVGVERPMTGPFKKPLGVSMARCHKCRLMITVYPPE